MIKKLYRFVKGVLTVHIRGKNTTRFLNLCIRAGIEFWDVEYLDALNLRMCMYPKEVRRLSPFLRKTHVRFLVEQRYGFPFLLRRYRARKVYALIFAAMLAAVVLLSTRIWRIDVIGNASIGEETMIRYLDTKDVRYGVKKSLIDNDALELSIRQDFDEVIWASVYEQGTRLVVSIQEKLMTDQRETSGDICMDLVAKRDATILSIVTRQGTPKVVAQDVVKAGDLLVSGRQEIIDDNGELREYYYRSADADVIGTVSYDYEDWIIPTISRKRTTGNETKQYYLTIGAWRFRFPPLFADYDDYETLEDIRQLILMDSFYLPVYYGKIRQLERVTDEVTLSEDEVRQLARTHLQQFLSDLEENGVSISEKNVMMEKTGENYHIYGKITASESIAQAVPTEMLSRPYSKTSTEEE